jgi:hypothetical protein
MPDGAVTGIEVEGARTGHTTRYEGRIVNVSNPRHERALRELGAFPVNVGGRARSGYRCPTCGFGSYVVTCSRCGGTCEREAV